MEKLVNAKDEKNAMKIATIAALAKAIKDNAKQGQFRKNGETHFMHS